MAANSQLTKIYDLKAIGGDTVKQELTQINSLLIEIVNTKAVLNKMRNGIEDPVELAKIDKAISNILVREKQLQVVLRDKQSVAREQQISNSKAIKDNEALAGSYDQLKAKYTELLAIAKGSVNLGNPEEVQAAAVELANLKVQIDAFDTSIKKNVATNRTMAASLDEVTVASAPAVTRLEELAALNEADNIAGEERIKKMLAENAALGANTLAQEENNASIAQSAAVTAEQNIEDDIQIASINIYRQYVKELTAERNDLNLMTAQGTVRQAELNAEIDAYNVLIKQSVDAYQQQKINIGNYPTATAELSALKQQMQQLALVGEQDSEAFAVLSARAQQLTAAMAEVTAATRETVSTAEALGAKLEKSLSIESIGGRFITMITRMGVHFLGFMIIMKGVEWIIGKVGEWIDAIDRLTKSEEEEFKTRKKIADNYGEEISKLTVLRQKIEDTNLLMLIRMKAIKDIQDQFPAYFNNLSKEEILAGKVGEAYKKAAEAIQASARVRVFSEKLGETEGNIDILKDRLLKEATARGIRLLPSVDKNGKNILAAVFPQGKGDGDVPGVEDPTLSYLTGEKDDKGKAIRSSIDKDLKSYNESLRIRLDLTTKIQANMDKAGNDSPDLGKIGKKPRVPDNARQEYQGLKELYDANAKRRSDQIEEDAQANELIYQNDKETLANRMLAYENYSSDKIYQAEATRDKIIADAKAEAAAADKQLADPNKKTQEEVNSLHAIKQAARVKEEDAEDQLRATIAAINRKGATDIRAIVKSDVDTRLSGIDEVRTQAISHAADSEAALNNARKTGLISEKEFQDRKKLLADKEHIYELELIREYLTAQILAYNGTVDGLKQLQDKLFAIEAQLDAAHAKFTGDSQKRTFDLQKFYKDLKTTAVDAFKTIADAYIENENRKIDKDIEAQKNAQDLEKQKRLDQATSAAEKAAIEKEYAQNADKLERERFELHKKESLAQLEIEFAVASAKAIIAATPGPTWLAEVAANEALVLLEYGAKYAALQSATYAQGGALKQVMVNGGVFTGPSHTNGGIRFSFGGVAREVQGKEGYVINDGSMGSNRSMTVSGTPAQIASAANVVGGGVNFAPGASFGYGGSLGAGLTAPYFSPASSGNSDAMMAMLATVQHLAMGVAATNGRIDTLRVELNPHAVTGAQERKAKLIKMTTL